MNVCPARNDDHRRATTVAMHRVWAKRLFNGKRISLHLYISFLIFFCCICCSGCPEIKLGGDWSNMAPQATATGIVVRYGVAVTIPGSSLLSDYDIDQCHYKSRSDVVDFYDSYGSWDGFGIANTDVTGHAQCFWVVADVCSPIGWVGDQNYVERLSVYTAAAAYVAQSMGAPVGNYSDPSFNALVNTKADDWCNANADCRAGDIDIYVKHFQIVYSEPRNEACGIAPAVPPYLQRIVHYNTGDERFGLATVDPTQSEAQIFLYIPGMDGLVAETTLTGTIGGLKRNCQVGAGGHEICDFLLTHALFNTGSFSLGSEDISGVVVGTVGMTEGDTIDNWVNLYHIAATAQFTDADGTWMTKGSSGAALQQLSWDSVAGKVGFHFSQVIDLQNDAYVLILVSGSATFLNRSPVAVVPPEFKKECEGKEQATVLLDGSQSYDPDGNLNLDWASWHEGSVANTSPLLGKGLTYTMSAPLGFTPVYLEIIDTWMTIERKETTVTVVDTTPPRLTCPEPQVVECTGPTGAVASYNPIASDICSEDLALNCAPTSGSVFPIGATSVSCQASDPTGNKSICDSSVKVVDTTPPVLSGVPADETVQCDTVPAPVTVTATDKCDTNVDLSFSQTRVDGNCADNYSLTRTWTAVDHNGNMKKSSQIITVQDTMGPVISCNNPATMIPSQAPISFTATALDNCGTSSAQITNFNCFSLKKGIKSRLESCVVEISGDKINILNSGGVDDNITWTVHATDGCANSSDQVCSIQVVNANK
jgi:hypothetical protein